jgi:protein-glutamine gamma-glutamyltransferase
VVDRTNVKRYCEISCHAVVGTAFFALAITGRLDLPSIIVFAAFLAGSLYRTVCDLPPILTSRTAFFLSCAYIAIFLVDFSVISGSLITSTIHMVLFLEILKLYQEKTDRDYLSLIVLSFMKILAASSLTVDIAFATTLFLFLVALVSMLMSFDIYRSERNSRMTTQDAAIALSNVSVWTTLWIVLLGSVFFFLIPRVGTGYFTRASAPPLLLSGFTDRVELGQIGKLKLSSAVVMHVRRLVGTPFAVFKWRGVALDTFDGFNWSKKDRTRRPVARRNSAFAVRRGPVRGEVVTYDILLEPLATTALFGPYEVREVSGRMLPGIETDSDGAIYTRFQQSQRLHYEVESEISANLTVDHKPAVNGPIPDPIQATYLQLPATLDPRIKSLAQEITRNANTPLEKAARIEAYLRRNYKYTLTLTWNPGTEPLSTFLFQAKTGHCEYFASALAVLLRADGVPTRMVNGFLMGEYNPVGDVFVVRQSDAHSWVEVYLPGVGWREFDPTPADTNEPDGDLIAQLENYADAIGLIWNTYILTYDTDSQALLFRNAQEAIDSLRDGIQHSKDEWAYSTRQFVDQLSITMRRTIDSGMIWVYAADLLVALLLYGNRQELRNQWLLFHLRRTGRVSGKIIPALFYRAVYLAEKRGPQRRESQTWREWIGDVPNDHRRSILQRALEVFERAKYGPDAPSASDVAILQQAVRELSLLQ